MNLDIGDSAANPVEEEYNPEQGSSSRMKLMVELNVLEMLRKPEHAMKQLVKVISELFEYWQEIFSQSKVQYDAYLFLFVAKVDCKWGPYGEWSACTKSCGGGFQTRLRDVEQQAFNGGAKCEGESTDLRVCNEHACPG